MGVKISLRMFAVLKIIMVVLLAQLSMGQAQATPKPVELYYAKAPEYNPTGSFYVEGHVATNFYAQSKKVTIHYTYNSQDWYDVSATYVGNGTDGCDVWSFKTPSSYASSCTFAIKYEAGTATFWDNNGGNNYKLQWYSPTVLLQKSALILKSAQKNTTSFFGTVALKNLGATKQVRIRYTTDNWLTFEEVAASYRLSVENNIEYWEFSAPIVSGATVKFAISYVVNGITYWDNNFGANYTL